VQADLIPREGRPGLPALAVVDGQAAGWQIHAFAVDVAQLLRTHNRVAQ
jgi:hypothetical protein